MIHSKTETFARVTGAGRGPGKAFATEHHDIVQKPPGASASIYALTDAASLPFTSLSNQGPMLLLMLFLAGKRFFHTGDSALAENLRRRLFVWKWKKMHD